MIIQEKLEEELNELLLELRGEPYDTQEYGKLLARAGDLEKLLSDETERANNLRKVEIQEMTYDQELQRLEIERAKLELSQSELLSKKREKIFEIIKTVIGGIVFVGANVAVIMLSIMANNSGETLPPIAQKVIGSGYRL